METALDCAAMHVRTCVVLEGSRYYRQALVHDVAIV